MNENLLNDKSFYRNYFYGNAFERYTNSVQEFIFWHRSSFLPPHKKNIYIDKFIEEERQRFADSGVFCLPSVQFAITTRCTLRCRDCSVMIPRFACKGMKHVEMTFSQFKRNLDNLLSAVDEIRTLLLLGGEPLLHSELPDFVDYAASKQQIGLIDIVTNCTIVPHSELIDVIKKFSNKVFFGHSNYTNNPAVAPRIRCEEIIDILHVNDIKHTLDTGNTKWFRYTLEGGEYTQRELQNIFDSCQWHTCLYVLGDNLSICSRGQMGHMLGAYNMDADGMVSLREANAASLRQTLLSFYTKEFLDACRFCHRHDALVEPAIQLDES